MLATSSRDAPRARARGADRRLKSHESRHLNPRPGTRREPRGRSASACPGALPKRRGTRTQGRVHPLHGQPPRAGRPSLRGRGERRQGARQAWEAPRPLQASRYWPPWQATRLRAARRRRRRNRGIRRNGWRTGILSRRGGSALRSRQRRRRKRRSAGLRKLRVGLGRRHRRTAGLTPRGAARARGGEPRHRARERRASARARRGPRARRAATHSCACRRRRCP